MSLTINDIYKYAKLATAGYIDLSGAADFDPATLRRRAAGEGPQTPRMPEALGNQFFTSDGWRVVSDPRIPANSSGSHNDPESGFAATLFQRGTVGEKVLSIRGTEPAGDQLYLDLIKADISQIGFLGIAISQTVSLFNLVQRMKALPGQVGVQQLQLHTTFAQPPTANFVKVIDPFSTTRVPVFKYYWLEARNNGVGVGGIYPGDSITVVGHSLGGHLAAMATRLFSETFSSAVVFNSARYDPPTSAALTSTFLNLFSQFGATPTAQFNNVSMFDSEDQTPGNDTSVVSSLIAGKLYGPLANVTTEENSHVIEPFMDSLSLQALMCSMNSDMSSSDTGHVVEAISSKVGDSDERLLQALYKALKGQELPLIDFQAGLTRAGDIQARQKFYEGLTALEDVVKGNPALHFDNLVGISASDLSNIARGSEALGYRYALKNLNPFAIIGDNTIYATQSANGELDLYNPSTDKGALTDKWLQDRAALLGAVIKYNTEDRNDQVAPGDTNYFDAERQLTLRSRTATKGIGFAKAGVELTGHMLGEEADLFGSGGDDKIVGALVRNYIEGGAGNDTITTFDGADEVHGGDGADTIKGGDGNNLIIGGKGSDSELRGGKDVDTIWGDEQQDTARYAGANYGGNDNLYGEDGNDFLYGGGGDDRLEGGKGSDFLYGDGMNPDDSARTGSDNSDTRFVDLRAVPEARVPLEKVKTRLDRAFFERINDVCGAQS